ncbi:hypothetical protein MTR_8g022650 [Medicago truncatula]|uniref:Uncharacterized protein n=1 Tax=Medicago truncatula TaxID=3880 RepID=G7L926_MEDTR|nr:hypothetical protein MTR_8g022650 [Medicago truncatula]
MGTLNMKKYRYRVHIRTGKLVRVLESSLPRVKCTIDIWKCYLDMEYVMLMEGSFRRDTEKLLVKIKKILNLGLKVHLDKSIKIIDDFTCSVIRKRKEEI